MDQKINQESCLYNLLSPFIHFRFKLYYRHIQYEGLERIPKDAAVIFAPNHCNALMDALAVLTMTRDPKVFVARADLFKRPLLARFLTFIKIMPVMRMRDGYQHLKRNQETIDKAVEVLKDHTPFCIFPEAAHQVQRTVLPLSKGIFRIALQAQRQMKEPLYIVPVGLNYENFFHTRSNLLVNIGQPIAVNPYLNEAQDLTEAEIMNHMRQDCSEQMHRVVHYIASGEDLEQIEELTMLGLGTCKTLARRSLAHELAYKQQATAKLEALREKDPTAYKDLIALSREARIARQEANLQLEDVALARSFGRSFMGALLLLLTFPYTLVMGVLFSPVFMLSRKLVTKIGDPIFYTTVFFVLNLVLGSLLIILYGMIGAVLLTSSIATGWVLSLLFAPTLLQQAKCEYRRCRAEMALFFNKDLKAKIEAVQKRIID